MKTFYIVEASHLFRAGDKYQTQFFVLDVVNYLHREFFSGDFTTIVLHGSVKETQANKYTAALERHGVKVIRMKPIASQAGAGRHFFKPTFYVHRMMGTDIPVGSRVVFIGLHNLRYLDFLSKYAKDFQLNMAAFTTPKKAGWMTIPEEFLPHLDKAIQLDDHVDAIKAEFRRKK